MDDFVVRRFEERDRAGFNRIRSVTYRGGKPVLDGDNLLPDDCIGFVADRRGEIPGAFTVIDMTATRGEAIFECGGICAVGVAPEERRTGVGTAMMSEGLRLLREEGYHLASLYAYRETYYRRFGYEGCGTGYDIACPADRLPKVRSDLPIRQLQPEEFEQLRPCYAAFARRYSGMNTRAHERFWPKASDDPPTVYGVGHPLQAYVVLRLDPAFWTDQPIRELVWLTPEGYRALLTLFQGFAINKNAVRWSEPSDSPFKTAFYDQGVDLKVSRPTMFRVLDVPAALEILSPEGEGEFVLEVDDRLMPENVGPWRVEFGDGRVSVTRSSATPDVQLDVRPFVQALLGEPSLSDLIRLGMVRLGRADAVQDALRLLPPNPTTCVDSF